MAHGSVKPELWPRGFNVLVGAPEDGSPGRRRSGKRTFWGEPSPSNGRVPGGRMSTRWVTPSPPGSRSRRPSARRPADSDPGGPRTTPWVTRTASSGGAEGVAEGRRSLCLGSRVIESALHCRADLRPPGWGRGALGPGAGDASAVADACVQRSNLDPCPIAGGRRLFALTRPQLTRHLTLPFRDREAEPLDRCVCETREGQERPPPSRCSPRLAEEAEGDVRGPIGLGQDGDAGLLQNLRLGEFRGLVCEVRVLDAALCS